MVSAADSCLTRFLYANRYSPSDQVRGHASLENALEAKPVRDRLAHDIGQRLVGQRRNRHPARPLQCTRTRGNFCGVDHKLQRKMREYVGDDSRLAMPARDALERGRLLQRRLVLLSGK